MAHKHTCLDCGKVITEGDFDCELDRDHDFELCDDCAAANKNSPKDEEDPDIAF